jgi:hypothetical protein
MDNISEIAKELKAAFEADGLAVVQGAKSMPVEETKSEPVEETKSEPVEVVKAEETEKVDGEKSKLMDMVKAEETKEEKDEDVDIHKSLSDWYTEAAKAMPQALKDNMEKKGLKSVCKAMPVVDGKGESTDYDKVKSISVVEQTAEISVVMQEFITNSLQPIANAINSMKEEIASIRPELDTIKSQSVANVTYQQSVLPVLEQLNANMESTAQTVGNLPSARKSNQSVEITKSATVIQPNTVNFDNLVDWAEQNYSKFPAHLLQ